MLLHVEAQLLRLAGEHFGELEEIEEEHELEVLAGQFLAFFRRGLRTGGGFTGLVDGDPIVLEVGGQGDRGGSERGTVGRRRIEQGLQVCLDLVIAAGLEDRAAIWQRFEQGRGVGTEGGDEAGLDAFDVDRDDLLPVVVLGQLARSANAQAALIIGDAVFDEAERAGGGGDAGGEFAARIVGGHPLKMIRGERGELGHADAVVVEGIPEE